MSSQAQKDKMLTGAQATVARLEAKKDKLRGELGAISTKLDKAKARAEWLASMPADDAPTEEEQVPVSPGPTHNAATEPEGGERNESGPSRRGRKPAHDVTTPAGVTEHVVDPPPFVPDPVFPPAAADAE